LIDLTITTRPDTIQEIINGGHIQELHYHVAILCTFTEKLEIKNPTDTAKSINWNDLVKPFVCEKLLKNNTRDWDKINSLTKIITIVFQ
jgi:hypothetical protein